MKTVSINTYKFEELDEAAQERAISELRDINTEFEWYDYDFEYHKEKLAEIGFMDAEISFSGFWCQGDGASFVAKVDLEKMINNFVLCTGYDETKDFYALLKLQEKDLVFVSFDIERVSSHYSHENTCRTKLWDNEIYIENYSVQFDKWFYDVLERLEQEIEDLRYSVSQDIYFSLRKEYEYQTSDEVVRETIIINEYDFTEDGKLF